jgi:TRAP transporter 4TM/12TM fusion protein
MKSLLNWPPAPEVGGLRGWPAWAFACGAISLSVFLFFSAALSPLAAFQHRMLFVTGTLTLIFLIYPIRGEGRDGGLPWYDVILVLLSLGAGLYSYTQLEVIALRGGAYTQWDYVASLVLLALILEAARRAVGLALVVLAVSFVLYAIFGRPLPGVLRHFGFSLERVTMHLTLTTEGVIGMLTGIAATYVFLFVLFGAFLSRSGMIDFFNNMSVGLAGGRPGGPAKVAVLGSAVMGTINGSAASNVATTGAFSIPLMKRIGYKAPFAGAVESVASTGGQIMPPVMGAGAFIMAEALAIPYREVMFAAILPALLYFGGVWFAVDLRARHHKLGSIPADELPSLRETVLEKGHLAIPLAALIYMLVAGYSALYAASIAILITLPVSWLRRQTRLDLERILLALIEGAKASLSVSIACILVGFIVGVVSLTGLGARLGYSVVSMAGDLLPMALLLTMLVCIVLGMGLPTSAAYIVASTIAVPILAGLGVDPLSANFFVFYFAILAGITPPVAITSFIAAGIARAPSNLTSMIALRIALPGFIVPFLFIANDALLISESASLLTSLVAFSTSMLGVFALTVAFEGYFIEKLNSVQRLLYAATASLFLLVDWTTDLAGLMLFATLAIFSLMRRRLRTEQRSTVEETR